MTLRQRGRKLRSCKTPQTQALNSASKTPHPYTQTRHHVQSPPNIANTMRDIQIQVFKLATQAEVSRNKRRRKFLVESSKSTKLQTQSRPRRFRELERKRTRAQHSQMLGEATNGAPHAISSAETGTAILPYPSGGTQ